MTVSEKLKKFSLNDSVMNAVSGGVMPEGFYDELAKYIRGAAAEGVRMEDFLSDLRDEYSSGMPAGMTGKDMDEVLKFVEKNWPKK